MVSIIGGPGTLVITVMSTRVLSETHSELQAVDATGQVTHPKIGADPVPANLVVLEGIVLNNPEDMLVTAIASCHMLWYLHLCSVAGIIVTSYSDEPVGVMGLQIDGAGQFEKVTLHPRIALKPGSNVEKARALHGEIHKYCFVSRSVNFPVLHEPIIIIGPA